MTTSAVDLWIPLRTLESRTILILAAVTVVGLLLINSASFSSKGDIGRESGSELTAGNPVVAMSGFRAIFVTVPSVEVGKKLAHGLVSKKLAACVNIIPQITSVYEWEGKIEEDSELLLMIKSQSEHFEGISKFVKENHPYSVPEVIAVPIEQGSQEYLDWIRKVTSPIKEAPKQ